ncbi:MAG: hypothetical protein CBB60_007810 [Armatimonadetes bacterium Cent15-Ar3]|nr:MAG: hypothetical protein CBB60_007810 [Armatimonadetes bacterium Cent15-Ar3]
MKNIPVRIAGTIVILAAIAVWVYLTYPMLQNSSRGILSSRDGSALVMLPSMVGLWLVKQVWSRADDE